jgi:shikimate dehydrogenase
MRRKICSESIERPASAAVRPISQSRSPEAALETIRLGLIGDNIAASRAPDLHHAAARICGIDVRYERLVPRDLGLTFDDVVEWAKRDSFRGLNITYPYKEQVLRFVTIGDPVVRAMGACNTMLFGAPATGFNTDYTGYVSAFRAQFGARPPGAVAMAGSGGVGKAVAFGLAELGAKSLTLFDVDEGKSRSLAAALQPHRGAMSVQVAASLAEACEGADGLVNCTPSGMVNYGGSAFSGIPIKGRGWIFDAVYTPVRTAFVREAEAVRVEILSGYELFLYQGGHAFRLFTGCEVDVGQLRRMLDEG